MYKTHIYTRLCLLKKKKKKKKTVPFFFNKSRHNSSHFYKQNPLKSEISGVSGWGLALLFLWESGRTWLAVP